MLRGLTLSLVVVAAAGGVFMSSIQAANGQSAAAAQGTAQANPLLVPSPLPFQAPPFDKIKDADFQPALEEGMRQHLAEANAIAENPAPATFENTLVALEKSGQTLTRVQMVFTGLSRGVGWMRQLLERIEISSPPLEKGDLGGFALAGLGEIPPCPPFAKGGNTCGR